MPNQTSQILKDSATVISHHIEEAAKAEKAYKKEPTVDNENALYEAVSALLGKSYVFNDAIIAYAETTDKMIRKNRIKRNLKDLGVQ